MKKQYFITQCKFEDFDGIKFLNGAEGLDIELFCKELKELMEKHKVKEICPTHRKNAKISRHMIDDELHIFGMYFTAE